MGVISKGEVNDIEWAKEILSYFQKQIPILKISRRYSSNFMCFGTQEPFAQVLTHHGYKATSVSKAIIQCFTI